jgi:hypothetical protein
MNDEGKTKKELGRFAGLLLWVLFLGVFAGTFVGVMNLGVSVFKSKTGKTYVTAILYPGRKAELRKLNEDLDAQRYERHLRSSMLYQLEHDKDGNSIFYQLEHDKTDTAVRVITTIGNIKEDLLKLDVSIHRLEYNIRQLGVEPPPNATEKVTLENNPYCDPLESARP